MTGPLLKFSCFGDCASCEFLEPMIIQVDRTSTDPSHTYSYGFVCGNEKYVSLLIDESKKVYLVTMEQTDNRFGRMMVDAFDKCLDCVESHLQKRNPAGESGRYALMTIGNGRFYSNGLNISEFFSSADPSREMDKDAKRKAMRELLTFLDDHFLPLLARMLVFPIPTIALINGHAFAGGLLLALSHDYRIGQCKQGFICMNEIKIGLSMHPGMMALLHAKIKSDETIKDALLNAKRWTGMDALKDGLVDAAVPFEQLLEKGTLFIIEKSKQGHGGPIYQSLKMSIYEDAWKMLSSGGSSWKHTSQASKL